MEIILFGYRLTVILQERHGWKQKVISDVNARLDGTPQKISKIEHIKAVRDLGFLFPKDYSKDMSLDGKLLGLSASKKFVEENWSEFA